MPVDIPKEFYFSALSIFILCVGLICALMQRVFPGTKKIVKPEFLQLFILTLALMTTVQNTFFGTFLGGSFVFDGLTQISHTVLLSVSLFISILFLFHPLKEKFFQEEISFLFLTITMGLLVFTSSKELITILISLELSSLAGYTILGYLDPNRKSLEGSIKYFLLGSIATAVMLLGFGFLYASTGSLHLESIFQAEPNSLMWFKGGFLLFFIGLCFKLALAPFHLWAPDAYEGAPTGITALLATSFKASIIILLIRLEPLFASMSLKLWVLPLATMIFLSIVVGNIMALSQTSLKRILAYSSIAHSAYIALGLCSLSRSTEASSSLLFYTVSYTLGSLIAFGSLMFMERLENQNLTLDEICGYAKKNKWVSFCLSFSLISLAGLPPTLGFLGKLFVFKGAVEQHLFFLTITAILGSCVSLFYYLRIIVCLYMKEESTGIIYPPTQTKTSSYLVLGIPLVITILLGTLFPQKVFDKTAPRKESSKFVAISE